MIRQAVTINPEEDYTRKVPLVEMEGEVSAEPKRPREEGMSAVQVLQERHLDGNRRRDQVYQLRS